MKKEHVAIFLSFFLGCVFTNVLGNDLLTTYGILNDYFLSQFSYYAVDGNQLLAHILFERGKAAVTIFLLGWVMPGAVFSVLVKSMAAATSGFLLTVAVINLGVKGIAICIGGLLPQWIFYFATLFYYANTRKASAYSRTGNVYTSDTYGFVLHGLIPAVGMAFGVLTECYVNPLLLAYIIKIF